MSKRILRGIGAAMAGLGEDIATRDAQSEQRAFIERRDAVNHARQRSLEQLRQQFAVDRQQAGWERDDTVTADQRAYAESRDAIARERKLEDDAAAHGQQKDLIDYRARVEAENRPPSPPKYEQTVTPDGRIMVYDPATREASPVTEAVNVETTRAGVKPNEPAIERSTRTERRPLITAPKQEGTTWQVVPHPTERGRFVQRSSNGDYKALPDTGPEWKITPGQFGGATAVNQSTGQSKVLLPGADSWVDQPSPGGEPAPAPRAAPGGGDVTLPANPSDDDLRAYYRAQGVPDARIEEALAKRRGGESEPRKPLIQRPTKNTDRGLREAYDTSPEVRDRMLSEAREVVRSGSDQEVINFWRTNGSALRAFDPQGLYNAFRNRLQKMRGQVEEPAAPPVDSRSRDEFLGGVNPGAVPGMGLSQQPLRR